jgi:hypothetical protein
VDYSNGRRRKFVIVPADGDDARRLSEEIEKKLIHEALHARPATFVTCISHMPITVRKPADFTANGSMIWEEK